MQTPDAEATPPITPDQLKEMMRPVAEQRGIDIDSLDIDWADFAKATAHPLAIQQVMESQSREPQSLQPGDPAGDFRLRKLNDPDAPAVRLSDSFGKRPVALAFGSYT